MEVLINDDWIYLDCTDFAGRDLGATYIKSKKRWRLPNTVGALKEIAGRGTKDPVFLDYAGKKALQREKHVAAKKVFGHEKSFWQKELRPYQVVDVNYLKTLPHAGVFNEMRTGKTPTTLTTIAEEDWNHTIVVCPASLVLNWKQEVEKWTSLEAFAIRGAKKQRLKTYEKFTQSSKSVLIISIGTLVKDYYEFLKPSGYCLVVDEAHFLRNTKTKQSKITNMLGAAAKKRYALTGTPVMNHGSEIFGILAFLFPTKYRSYTQFEERYFNTYKNFYGGTTIGKRNPYKRKDELQEILDLVSIQRKRAEVMNWIPRKQYQVVPLEMSAKQQKAYDDMANMFEVEQDGELVLDASGVLAQIMRLRQISLEPALVGIKAPSAKTEFLMEWLESNPGEQLVVFSNFSQYFDLLLPTLCKKYKVGQISGSISLKDRQKNVEKFQRGDLQILLCNIQAAGVGLTLDASSTVIFMDRNYVPALNDQAEDRIVPTQKNSNMDCLIIDLLSSPIDTKIRQVLGDKIDITQAVNDYKFMRKFLDKT